MAGAGPETLHSSGVAETTTVLQHEGQNRHAFMPVSTALITLRQRCRRPIPPLSPNDPAIDILSKLQEMGGAAMCIQGTTVTVDLEKKKDTGPLGTLVDIERKASWFGPGRLGMMTYLLAKLLGLVFLNGQMRRVDQVRSIPWLSPDGHHFAIAPATAALGRPPVPGPRRIVSMISISGCGGKHRRRNDTRNCPNALPSVARTRACCEAGRIRLAATKWLLTQLQY